MDDIHLLVKEVVRKFIEYGKCYILSPLILYEALKRVHIRSKIVVGYIIFHKCKKVRMHVWIQLSDGEALDPYRDIIAHYLPEDCELPAILRIIPRGYTKIDTGKQSNSREIIDDYMSAPGEYWKNVPAGIIEIRNSILKL